MSISYETLINKMEIELNKARQAKGAQQLRGHMYALKALAEVVLEEGQSEYKIIEPFVDKHQVTSNERIQQVSPVSTVSTEPLKTEDGANGDSLFDF
ncbi:YwdI family protein [Lederbergia citrea]|uniref:YwdI family protein n=1 Tax=Lederbergia citrea TaxID=2833581 RepID=UPI001BC96315|nr:YwdI family protein [Lederbergia citrea]MBS4177997.1 YwdI family protein [Lederbergia citrea]MBS4204664.1 YwdI family protein [Lederbergia citrea]